MQLKDLFSKKASVPIKLLRISLLVPIAMIGLDIAISTLPDDGFPDKDYDALTKIFGDSVDFNAVDYVHSPIGDAVLRVFGAAGMARDHTIIMSTDYKTGSELHDYTLIHEAVHLWQDHNCAFNEFKELYEGIEYSLIPPLERYKYDLDADKDLRDYNYEAQASIIADYYYYIKNGEKPYLLEDKSPSVEELELIYSAVLKNFKNDPKYIRKQCNLGLEI